MKREPTFNGNRPTDWGFLAAVEHGDDVWELWERPGSEGREWKSIKLVLVSGRARKANFWLAFSTVQMRFARSREAHVLTENRPALHERLLAELAEVYG